MKYLCIPCGYIFDEEEQENRWAELPEEWVCPECEGGKNQFAQFNIDEDSYLKPEEEADLPPI